MLSLSLKTMSMTGIKLNLYQKVFLKALFFACAAHEIKLLINKW